MHSCTKFEVSLCCLMYFSLEIIDPIGQRTLLEVGQCLFHLYISLALSRVPGMHKTLNRSILKNRINRFQNILNKWINNSLETTAYQQSIIISSYQPFCLESPPLNMSVRQYSTYFVEFQCFFFLILKISVNFLKYMKSYEILQEYK